MLLNISQPPFANQILRTTWQDLARGEHVQSLRGSQYRLTARGWLAALEISGVAQSKEYQERIGRVLAAMKGDVKGRHDAAVVSLRMLASEAGEPEGFIYNIVESRASVGAESRRDASWFGEDRGRLVEIPVDFNMEPVDVVASLTVPHLERIQALEERLQVVEEDRANTTVRTVTRSGSPGAQDFPEHDAIVAFDRFACGLLTADGSEEEPCPYSSAGHDWTNLTSRPRKTAGFESVALPPRRNEHFESACIRR